MNIVRSVENRIKLINYLLSVHQGFMAPSRQVNVTSVLESCTLRAYKAKKMNPASDIQILLGMSEQNEQSGMEYCWFSVDGKEHLKIDEDYSKIIKISLLKDETGTIKGKAEKLSKIDDLMELLS